MVASRPASPHPSRLLGLALRLSRSCLSMPPGNPRRAGGWHLRRKPCVENVLYVPFFFPVTFSHPSSVFFFCLHNTQLLNVNMNSEQYTHKCSTYRVAHSTITFHHVNMRSSRIAHLCVLKNNCHPCVMSHLPLFAFSPIFSLTSQTPTTFLEHDEHVGPDERPHCVRQSGGFTQTVTPTGYEPNIIETKVIDSEAISPEDLEPRRIELDRNLGTDPYQIHERFLRSSLTGDVKEFRKVAVVSYFQSQMHSEYESSASIADSDLEDGELRKMLASPLYLQNREDYESFRMPQSQRGRLLHCYRREEQLQKSAHAD